MKSILSRPVVGSGAVLVAALAACADVPTAPPNESLSVASASNATKKVQCDPDNGGITLPPGFCAVVVADLVMDGEPARARHMAITPAGVLFVAINSPGNDQPSFGIIALRDTDGDGRADEQEQFSRGLGGSGIAWGNAWLYFGANDRVLRFRQPAGRLTPVSGPETVVSGLPSEGDHISKSLALADGHTLFVNIGSASNSCQEDNREVGSPGVFPCPELPIRAGVWSFDPRATNQTQSDGVHWATGLRNIVALTVHPNGESLRRTARSISPMTAADASGALYSRAREATETPARSERRDMIAAAPGTQRRDALRTFERRDAHRQNRSVPASMETA